MASDKLRTVVSTRKAPGPSPHNSQAIVVNGPLIFVSGQMGVDVHTNELVKGNIKERVVSFDLVCLRGSNDTEKRMTLRNLETVLYAAGSDLTRIVKVIYIISH
jgi:enamine deaminase RidA (YjgF/YER057c/UK114 family)